MFDSAQTLHQIFAYHTNLESLEQATKIKGDSRDSQ